MLNPRSAVGSWRAWRLSPTALLLVLSCGDPASTNPLLESGRSETWSAIEAPVFVLEPTPMSVPTYDGSGQAVHPDVVAFDSPWHGARYWISMTPYAGSQQTLENPSILTSDNGIDVSVPAGLANPVVKPPRRARDYNSDPELIYEPQTDRLVLFHRLVDKKANTIHVSTSRDGVTWRATPAPFWERRHQAVSPTVAARDNAPARMWYVNAGKKGCDAKATSVVMRTARDSSGRVVDTRWSNPVPTDLSVPGYVIWHIKARWIPAKGEYWMLLSAFPKDRIGCRTDDLFFARSSDGLRWTVYAEPIVRHEQREWTASAVYRSTFLYDPGTDELRLWLSAQGADGAWRLGYARARYSALRTSLETGQRVSPVHTAILPRRAVQFGEQP
jgi:hypothetical protein